MIAAATCRRTEKRRRFERGQCTACERVVGHASAEVNKLVFEEKLWSKEIARSLMDKTTKGACANEELFAKNAGALLDGCMEFVAQYYDKVRNEYRKHLHPRYDEFMTDVVPRRFCLNIGACTEADSANIDRQIRVSDAVREWKEQMLAKEKDPDL